ncbi:unnamed protein product [Schistosoma margrebowiei]|uniref:Uncharacterized protein n=1 Tax=Schistosoma margrebowiei TaxID=48269 RepID=A0AA84ZGY2_9TREM|nr:unnamed protein product [Schistosoma margrebowiei]
MSRPSKKHIISPDAYSTCKRSKSVTKVNNAKPYKHTDQSASYSDLPSATLNVHPLLGQDISLPCISLVDINKSSHMLLESTSLVSPKKSTEYCEQYLDSAADPKHPTILRSAILSSGSRITTAYNSQPDDVDLDYSPRHIPNPPTKCAQSDHPLDTCNRPICNHIDLKNFDINLNNLTTGRPRSTQTELSLTQTIQDLLPYKYLISVPENPDLEIIKNTEKIIDHISTEVLKRLQCMHNVIVYNIPDSTNIKIAKNTLLQECGLSQSWCVTRRLRKGHTKTSCPILFQFGSTTEANHLLNSQSLLRRIPTFKKIRIIHDRTAIQRRICNGTQTDQPSLRSRGSYSSCHCTNPKISYTAPQKNGGTSDTAINPKDKTAHKAATTTHPHPKHSATPKCQTTYASIASKYHPSGPCKMPKNDHPRNCANSYRLSDIAVRNNTKPSVKTHQYSSTSNPKRAPSHSNRMPYNKHSELATPTHPNVKRHLTRTTPTRDTHKSYSVNLASPMDQHKTIHIRNTSLSNNNRHSFIPHQKHTTSPTNHNRTKIAHRTQRSHNVGLLGNPPTDSRYYLSQATQYSGLVPPNSTYTLSHPFLSLPPSTLLLWGLQMLRATIPLF